jgi:O-methyltransferase involved in polyketide biosynthesis
MAEAVIGVPSNVQFVAVNFEKEALATRIASGRSSLLEAAQVGVRQYVILGAGLDTFAYSGF